MKVLNASKFVLGSVGASGVDPTRITEPVDKALLARLLTTCRRATTAFEAYDYTTALEVTEKFFWEFCDDYLELVKERAYDDSDPGSESAKVALACSLHTVLRLLAPFLPYVTEEVWSWWQDGSIHLAPWPADHEGSEIDADGAMLDAVAAALMGIRGAKSQAKVSMRAPLSRVEVTGPQDLVEAAASAAADLRRAGHVQGDLVFTLATDATEITVAAELASEG
jgi:valyl-tRNA synthetase